MSTALANRPLTVEVRALESHGFGALVCGEVNIHGKGTRYGDGKPTREVTTVGIFVVQSVFTNESVSDMSEMMVVNMTRNDIFPKVDASRNYN